MANQQRLANTFFLFLIITGSFIFLVSNPLGSVSIQHSRPFKAALVDEVAATYPDPYLTDNITLTLTRAGYSVDYFGPNDVTVDFFRSLPSMGYGIIILRNHATASVPSDLIAFVTSELFNSTKYVNEQEAGLVVDASVDNTRYFAITPAFFRQYAQGRFSNTIIIAEGCGGLVNSEMAQAFVSRGANIYISWDGTVQTNQSDGGTILLMQQMIAGHRVDDAVTFATENSPASILYTSQMRYYPLNEAGLVLPAQVMK